METLGRLWMEGRTASQIAGVLGAGITRNAVIGKVHRLGLSSGANIGLRAATIKSSASGGVRDAEDAPKTVPEAAPVKARVADRIVASAPKTTSPVSSYITIAGLTDEKCRWPVDDPDSTEFLYCGAAALGNAPYCPQHCKLAYQPARPMRRPPDRHALFPGLVAVPQKA